MKKFVSAFRSFFKFDKKNPLEWAFFIWVLAFIFFFILVIFSEPLRLPFSHFSISQDLFSSIMVLLASVSAGFLGIFIAIWAFFFQYHLNSLNHYRTELTNHMVFLDDLVCSTAQSDESLKESISHLSKLWKSLGLERKAPIRASEIDDAMNSFVERFSTWNKELKKKINQLRTQKEKLDSSTDAEDGKAEYLQELHRVNQDIGNYNTLDTRGVVVIDLAHKAAGALMFFIIAKSSLKFMATFALFVIYIFFLLVGNAVYFDNVNQQDALAITATTDLSISDNAQTSNISLTPVGENNTAALS